MENETVNRSRSKRTTATESIESKTGSTGSSKKRNLLFQRILTQANVTVRNGFQGRLVYKSKRTGERFVWDSFGAEQDMEMSELRNARELNKSILSTTGSCSMSRGLWITLAWGNTTVCHLNSRFR